MKTHGEPRVIARIALGTVGALRCGMRIPEPSGSVGSFAEVGRDALAQVAGGFLNEFYKGLVFNIAAPVGGKQLAQKIFEGKTTVGDVAVGTAQMKKFLVDGNKLPKGVPNLFG